MKGQLIQQVVGKLGLHLPLVRFLIVGVANTLVGIGTMYAAMYFLGFDIVYANILGYAIGTIQSFLLNKSWTFGSSDRAVSSFIRFLLVLAVAYGANLATVVVANTTFGVNPYVAQALGIFPYTSIGFLGSRYFAFRNQRRAVLGPPR
jgi:putative flippase GtrA